MMFMDPGNARKSHDADKFPRNWRYSHCLAFCIPEFLGFRVSDSEIKLTLLRGASLELKAVDGWIGQFWSQRGPQVRVHSSDVPGQPWRIVRESRSGKYTGISVGSVVLDPPQQYGNPGWLLFVVVGSSCLKIGYKDVVFIRTFQA